MRDELRICLQHLTNHYGEFHPMLERWWDAIERQYKTCGSQKIPADHVPLWFARMQDEDMPIAAPVKEPKSNAPAKPQTQKAMV